MKKFFIKVKNIFSIQELKNRIINTFILLLIFRLGSYITLPGIDPLKLSGEAKGIFGLLDTFLGGAFSNASIFGLGIMPYISASIAVQLFTVAVPYFQKLQKEGESGRNKLNNITRILTIIITLVQSVGYLSATISDEMLLLNRPFFLMTSMIVLTAGTMFCMWLGERITDKGLGNGISMLIMVGIISSLPGALFSEVLSKGTNGMLLLLVEIIVLFFIIIGFVLFTQAIRKIPIQYAKQIVGNKVYGGQRQYIPLKFNAVGVMPIIFAQALMFLPALIASIWSSQSQLAAKIGQTFSDFTTWQYNVVFGSLIIIFTFFYTAITINPNQIADDMKRSAGFIPGIKPGKDTSNFIDNVLSHITLPGAFFLAFIAILPAIAHLMGVGRAFSQFFGGTSLLIIVGVVLDTIQQTESYLLMRHYDGLMQSGKI